MPRLAARMAAHRHVRLLQIDFRERAGRGCRTATRNHTVGQTTGAPAPQNQQESYCGTHARNGNVPWFHRVNSSAANLRLSRVFSPDFGIDVTCHRGPFALAMITPMRGKFVEAMLYFSPSPFGRGPG